MRSALSLGIIGSFPAEAVIVVLFTAAALAAGCDRHAGRTEGEPGKPVASAVASAPQVPASAGTTTVPHGQDRAQQSSRAKGSAAEIAERYMSGDRSATTGSPTALEPETPAPVKPGMPRAAVEPEATALVKPEMPPDARIYPKNVADKPVPRVGDQPWMIEEDWLSRHQRQVSSPRRAQAKLVFLGDSIVEAWSMAPAYREHFGKHAPLNLGLAGDHTQNVLWRIENGTLDGLKPDVVVVLVGINNLAGGFTSEQTAAGVRAVVEAVRARLSGAKVILLAILPARRSPTSPLRQKVRETNRLLVNLAKPGSVSFHDVGSALLEPDETISTATSRDALHPSAAGYERITAAVAPLVENLRPR